MSQLKLLINLTNQTINFVLYWVNQHQKLETIATHSFSTQKTIINSVIVNYDKLQKKIDYEYHHFFQQLGIEKLTTIDLIVPLQVPIINEINQANSTKEQIVYQKSFDQSQFQLLTTYPVDFANGTKHFSYFINKTFFDKYQQLFEGIKIKLTQIYSPALLLGQYFDSQPKYNLIIELDDKQTTYNFYFGQKIFYSKTIKLSVSFLIEQLLEQLKTKFSFVKQPELSNFQQLLNNQNIYQQKEVALIVCFNEQPTSFLYLSWTDLAKFWTEILQKVFVDKVQEFINYLQIPHLTRCLIYKNEFLLWLFNLNNHYCPWSINGVSSYPHDDFYDDPYDPLIMTYFSIINANHLQPNQISSPNKVR